MPAEEVKARRKRRRFGRLALIVIVVVACAALCAVALGLSRWWPLVQARVLQDLREASDSEVRVRAFHERYFPIPGCVLEGVVFHRGPAEAKPLITIEKVTIRASYLGLLSQRVRLITADGMHVFIPVFGTAPPFHTTHSKITVEEIVANGASVEFASRNPDKKPLRFDIHEALLRDVGWKGPLSYRMKVHNPEPPGEVITEGKFGVWNQSDPGETPISGEYKFQHADLSVYKGIAGTLSSTGKFGGTLAHIDISGATDIPDFEVKSGRHPVRLTTEFNAYVDATKGDTFLKHVGADFWQTHVEAQGSIATSRDGKGKTALIDLRASKARIEDLLRLFVKANRAPMSGGVTLEGRAEFPPGKQRFLEKLKLQGGFGIAGGTFAKPSTQEGVDKLSAGARGEKDQADPETVLTDLKGQVNLVAGTARFSDLSFGVPGAAARMKGTYNLLSHKIDLRGQLQVDSKISNTTSGPKAFLLKMMEPFFKKKRKGEIVPVRISGTFEHPTFGLDLNDEKAEKVPAP
jgi:AsmA-like C-terminal region